MGERDDYSDAEPGWSPPPLLTLALLGAFAALVGAVYLMIEKLFEVRA